MTAPTTTPVQDPTATPGHDPTSPVEGLAHYACDDTGPDDPEHSLCGTPVRGITVPPTMEHCGTCDELLHVNHIVTCAEHGSRRLNS